MQRKRTGTSQTICKKESMAAPHRCGSVEEAKIAAPQRCGKSTACETRHGTAAADEGRAKASSTRFGLAWPGRAGREQGWGRERTKPDQVKLRRLQNESGTAAGDLDPTETDCWLAADITMCAATNQSKDQVRTS